MEDVKTTLVNDVEIREDEIDEFTQETLDELSNNKGDEE